MFSGRRSDRKVSRFWSFTRLCIVIASVAFVITIVFAGRPWYKFGDDAFTSTVNGWNTCVMAVGTPSSELEFVVLVAIESVFALVARHKGRRRRVGVALATGGAVLGSVFAQKQLDGVVAGEFCNGYDFEVLGAARISTYAMITVLLAIAAAALSVAGSRKATTEE